MTEPELLRTLERLENEELLDAANPELPLPTMAGSEDYLSILQDLRNALGEPEEALAEPETPFADPQNILELEAVQEFALKTPEFENELELIPETVGSDFSADETDAAFSDFELKLPDEVLLREKTRAVVEDQGLGQLSNKPEPPASASDSDLSADPKTASFEAFAEPENFPSFIHSSAETAQTEPKITDEADSVLLEDFLSTQEFSGGQQTAASDISDDLFGSEPGESSLKLETPEFFNEFVFEETTESSSIFDSPSGIDEESNPKDFDFVPGVEETEFPEILHDAEETEKFSSDDFAAEETLPGETVSDFEPENFAPETEDFSEFLPDETKDFLSEFDDVPELPQFEATETLFEQLPEPALADKAEPINEVRSPFVVFKLDAQHFAFQASAVAEIAHEPQFTALPFVPDWFSGITNLRGDVIAVLDLRVLWEMPVAAPDARRKMLVVHSEKANLCVGLLVDAVSEIRYLGENEIDFAPNFFDQPFAFCVNGSSRITESPLPILDVERFLASPKLRQL